MNITVYHGDPQVLMPLLLLADEQESMIARYISRGKIFVLREDDAVRAECVVTDEGGGLLEVKNIAAAPQVQGRGYGKALLAFVAEYYRDSFCTVQVGTSPANIPFYEKCGFVRSHIVPGFFTQNYDHPIYENGVLLTDMIYLKKTLSKEDETR